MTPELAKGFGLKDAKGVLISDVVQDSPAEKAGLAAGDIVVEFDKKKVDTPQDLQKVVAVTAPGQGRPGQGLAGQGGEDLRDQDRRDAGGQRGAQVDQQEQDAARASSSGPITPEIARQLNLRGAEGVIVFSVEDDSPAAEAGLQRGDVIREVNRQSRPQPAGLRAGNQGREGRRPRDGPPPAGPAVALRRVHGGPGLEGRAPPASDAARKPALEWSTRAAPPRQTAGAPSATLRVDKRRGPRGPQRRFAI